MPSKRHPEPTSKDPPQRIIRLRCQIHPQINPRSHHRHRTSLPVEARIWEPGSPRGHQPSPTPIHGPRVSLSPSTSFATSRWPWKAEFSIARLYAGLVQDEALRDRVFSILHAEFELTRRWSSPCSASPRCSRPTPSSASPSACATPTSIPCRSSRSNSSAASAPPLRRRQPSRRTRPRHHRYHQRHLRQGFEIQAEGSVTPADARHSLDLSF